MINLHESIETKGTDLKAAEYLRDARENLIKEIQKVIVGQSQVIDQLMIALLSRGHCLLIGVPGLAKTLLISTLAKALDLDFNRIQFTPDLMPSDIIGTEIIQEDHASGERNMRFLRGPVFANVVLADEINRTPPKTQAALLQAMQEYKVSVGGITYELRQPFFVLATQNPIEQEGTYPLPEAQLDRFMFSIHIDYPMHEEEIEIVKSTTSSIIPELKTIMSGEEILEHQETVRRLPPSDRAVNYAVKLVRSTRPDDEACPESIREWISWGAGPRASQYLVLAAKARAIINGRKLASVDDVKAVANPVLRHRILTSFNAEAEGIDSLQIINELMQILDKTENL
ncbi:AAA domain-containing protein [Candidatus Poribacteria bacterium]|nr:AAA domain-containing protein [Candidatus Poribacteria bacterium]